ncbi:MAG: STAS domain-containing protein [Labilithrix sp.]|nr:STAS domain-containing protein [Labilithrix sp.]
MIRVHDESEQITFDVEGRATMLESRAVQETASAAIARGVRRVRFDLRDCTTMDSTFSGTLLALARRASASGGDLALVSPSSRARELLGQMGLDDFYAIELAPRAKGETRDLEPSWPKPEELGRLILEAHEELAGVPGPAAEVFRPVVDALRRNIPP